MIQRIAQHLPRRRRTERRGITIIMVIAFYAIAIAMIGLWVRSAFDRQQQVRLWQEKTQAAVLAEAGVRRAVALLDRDEKYAGELWAIEAEELASVTAAQVLIEIEHLAAQDADSQLPPDEQPRIRITAIASLPPGENKRVQHTKTIEYRGLEQANAEGNDP